ncbi:MAG: LL-diaminopimelate aminotransferase [Planctomycetaceae bacterium]|nr:LL-diaminopimelate aminotransferase [Planctomycetaceae bacterium]
MSDPYFQELFADRIGGANYGKGTDIYKFEKIKRAKRKALADFPDRPLLDFGIGENDSMADPVVRHALTTEANLLVNRGYADNGCLEFKEAAARFMQRRLNVTLDPVTEINHCIGSKSALSIFPKVFINPGDVTLMTVPGYPVAGTHTKYLGGIVHPLSLNADNGFYPDLDGIPDDVRQRAKLLVINYPNSPTGQVATAEFFEKVIGFAKKHNIVVVQDAAHLPFQFRGEPLSFLSVPGAKEVGVEIHSLSKGWDMIGWRIGWVCGNPLIVRAFSDVKDNTDSGQFLAVQKAAVVALDNDEILNETRRKYRRRLEKLVDTLNELGFQCEMPGGTYFLYVKAPQGVENGPTFQNAEAASQFLITQHSICTVPWDDAGAFLRFSVTYQAETETAEDELMDKLAERINSIDFVF